MLKSDRNEKLTNSVCFALFIRPDHAKNEEILNRKMWMSYKEIEKLHQGHRKVGEGENEKSSTSRCYHSHH